MRLRILLGIIGYSVGLFGLAACTSSIAGTATFGGPTQTTEATTEDPSETPEETTDEVPTGDPDEFVACITAPFSYAVANANFVELADAANNGTPTELTPESVAADFDGAIASVQPVLDPLPPGDVRDALQAAQTAASGLRDGLRSGAAINNTDLNAALDSIAAACDF